jgi:hypothetical protein
MTEFYNTEFINVGDDAFGYFYDPPRGWANPTDCGNFPCTAPWNVLLWFQASKFRGKRPSETYSNF